MLTTLLLTACLMADPASLDALQGTWFNVGGVRLTIDGNTATVATQDGWGFGGKATVTSQRLRIIEDDGSVVERRWRLDGGRLLSRGCRGGSGRVPARRDSARHRPVQVDGPRGVPPHPSAGGRQEVGHYRPNRPGGRKKTASAPTQPGSITTWSGRWTCLPW
jgi:hypothetical protein